MVLFYTTSNCYILKVLKTYSRVCTYTFCSGYLIEINHIVGVQAGAA